MNEDFEAMGAFYLGRIDSAEDNSRSLLLYQSKDLLTHGVCIGMTGSGKTGLCLSLIEEAAIDLIPVIAIDPKGDLGNLMLTFPNLEAKDFEPWVNHDEAQRLELSNEQLAAQKAQTWKDGLAKWGQDGKRIQKFKDAAEINIYTPGASAGLSVSLLGSLSAPPDEILLDEDLLSEKVSNFATCLLTLLGISADPLKSREHILLSNIISTTWSERKSIDLEGLIALIQNPPMKKIGALDLESFFSKKERQELAYTLNNLLASPGFAVWLKGAPLDIKDFLYTATGKPKVSIFSIAHLNDTERMFFVTLLLQQFLSWMRSQSGSSSLRAILYMDEIYGYFPPVANPPSKIPLLTLLKQARAYGVGILLASQNSVDLDYKGLANAGTWFIGRLQTERDKMRLLDGLEGAALENGKVLNRQDLEKLISRLRTRLFLLNNIHEDHPVVFESRWTLSYLFGPLARGQIKTLMSKSKDASSSENPNPNPNPNRNRGNTESTIDKSLSNQSRALPAGHELSASAATLPKSDANRFLPLNGSLPKDKILVYKPMIFASVTLSFKDRKAKLEAIEKKTYVVASNYALPTVNWSDSRAITNSIEQFEVEPLPGAKFLVPSKAMFQESSYGIWKKEFSQWLTQTQKFYLLFSPSTGEYSKKNENERDFRLRLINAASERRQENVLSLKNKFAPKLISLEQKIRHAQTQAEKAYLEARQQKVATAIDIGATVLGAMVGRRNSTTGLRQAASAAKEISKIAGETQSIDVANRNLQALENQLQALDSEYRLEISKLDNKYNPLNESLETVSFNLKPANLTCSIFIPVWLPYALSPDGALEELWR
jgi:hypothetical protein